ncbi:hypothetical protein MTO96_021226 [Rhipicephalus appendiculatus]
MNHVRDSLARLSLWPEVVRRDCRAPRCARCRRHGVEELQWVRTYANVAVPTAADENAERLVGELEAEEASVGSVQEVKVATTKSPKLQGQTTARGADVPETAARPVCKDSAVDVRTHAGGAVGKRTRERTNDGPKTNATSGEEPPQKSEAMRQSSVWSTPNVPPDRGLAATAPKLPKRPMFAKAPGASP